MYQKLKYYNTYIYLYQKAEDECLLHYQSKEKAKLSTFTKGVKAAINCNYFASYNLGRSQGNKFNYIYDKDDILDCVIHNHKLYYGDFTKNDFPNSKCGFSPAAIFDLKKDHYLLSKAIVDKSKLLNNYKRHTYLIYTKETFYFLVHEPGLNSFDIKLFVKEFLKDPLIIILLDGGGSSEMIVDGKIVTNNKVERPMFNALVIVDDIHKKVPKGLF